MSGFQFNQLPPKLRPVTTESHHWRELGIYLSIIITELIIIHLIITIYSTRTCVFLCPLTILTMLISMRPYNAGMSKLEINYFNTLGRFSLAISFHLYQNSSLRVWYHLVSHWQRTPNIRRLVWYHIKRPIVRSREVSKTRDRCLMFCYRSEIWQVSRQHCCGTACWIAFYTLLAICAGNPPVTGEFPAQRPVARSFDVFFDLRLNKGLNKQSWGWWFETLSRSLWRHRNGAVAVSRDLTMRRLIGYWNVSIKPLF